MPFEVKDEEGYQVVVFEGEVDLSCSPQARQAILGCLSTGDNVLVDLSLVSYIDSSGVASLVEGFQTAKKSSVEFGLVGVSDAAMAVLKLARLDQVFHIEATVADWVARR
jgi:anti-sigma B factor antagonist